MKRSAALLVLALATGLAGTVPAQEPAIPSRLGVACEELGTSFASRFDQIADIAELIFDRPVDATTARVLTSEWGTRGLDAVYLVLLDAQGNVIAAGPPDEQALRHISQLGAGGMWAQMESEDRPVLGAGISPEGTGVVCRTLFPLYSPDGTRAGAVCMGFQAASALRSIVGPDDLSAGETFHAVLGTGTVLYSAGRDAVQTGASYLAEDSGRTDLFLRMGREASGSATYVQDGAVREVEWLHCPFTDEVWILALERPAAPPPGPLAGRWVGAYSGAGDGDNMGQGGPLSVLVRQDGDRVVLSATLAGELMDAEGVVLSNRLSAARVAGSGEERSVWSWRGVYDPGRGSLKGEISGNARDRVATWSFFLRKAEKVQGPPPANPEP